MLAFWILYFFQICTVSSLLDNKKTLIDSCGGLYYSNIYSTNIFGTVTIHCANSYEANSLHSFLVSRNWTNMGRSSQRSRSRACRSFRISWLNWTLPLAGANSSDSNTPDLNRWSHWCLQTGSATAPWRLHSESLSLSGCNSLLVVGLEHVLFFHSVGNVIIPTDELNHFSEVLFYHQPVIINQWLTIINHY